MASQSEKEIYTPYPLAELITINDRQFKALQISNHVWKKPGREGITPDLIKKLVQKLNDNGPFVPEGRKEDQEFFKLEPARDQEKTYKLIWVLKDNNDYVWIKTCHQTKKKYNEKK